MSRIKRDAITGSDLVDDTGYIFTSTTVAVAVIAIEALVSVILQLLELSFEIDNQIQ